MRPPADAFVPSLPALRTASGAGTAIATCTREPTFDGTTPAPGTTDLQAWIPVTPAVTSDASNRSRARYDNVLNQFAVGVNPRYTPRNNDTFCNYFIWDVSKYEETTRGALAKALAEGTKPVPPAGTLRRGASGDAVAQLQDCLARMFYLTEGQIDGSFGPITEAAVRRLQIDWRLPQTGVYDAQVRAVMERAFSHGAAGTPPASAAVPQPLASPQVRAAANLDAPSGRGWSGVGGPDGILNAAAQRIDDNAATHQIGEPSDAGGGIDAHYWDGLVVRNYSGGPDSDWRACMVVDGPSFGKLIKGSFYEHYLGFDEGQPTHIALGAPLDEEHLEPTGYAVQNFEGGRMLRSPAGETMVFYFDQRLSMTNVQQLVNDVYQGVLGRWRGPSEGDGWVAKAQQWQNEGKSDTQIRNLLAAELRASGEFQGRVAAQSFPPPVGLAAIKARFGDAGQNIVTARLPLGPGGQETDVRINAKLLPIMRETLEDARRQGLLQFIRTFDGMAAEPPRFKQRPDGSILQPPEVSVHSWGIAVDINADSSGGQVDPRLVNDFKAHGFTWGGDFTGNYDPMHFQYASGY